MRTVLLDISTTGVRSSLLDRTATGWFETAERAEVAIPLGRVLGRDGDRDAGVLELLDTTCRRFLDRARVHGAASVAVVRSRVATLGGADRLTGLLEAVGVGRVVVLTPSAEGRHLLQAARAGLGLGDQPALSLEIAEDAIRAAAGSRGEIAWSASFPLGIHDVLRGTAAGVDAPSLRDRIRRDLHGFLSPLADAGPPHATIAGRPVAAVFRLLEPTGDLPLHGQTATVDRLRRLADTLDGQSPSQRLTQPALPPAEVDTAHAATTVLAAIAMDLDIATVTFSAHGLDTGIALLALGARPPSGPRENVRRAAVTDAMARLGIEREHADRVAATALALFDATARHLHTEPGSRGLLEHAARLLDAAVATSPAQHHRLGGELVATTDLRGFDPRTRAIVASLVRFQKGRPPGRRFTPFRRLDHRDREHVLRLAPLLRLAAGIHAGRDAYVRAVRFEPDEDVSVLTLEGGGDLEFALFGARSARDLFERVSGQRLVVRAEATTPTLEHHEPGRPATRG